MQAIRNGQITAADVIVGFGGFIDGAADEAAELKLAAKAKTIAEPYVVKGMEIAGPYVAAVKARVLPKTVEQID